MPTVTTDDLVIFYSQDSIYSNMFIRDFIDYGEDEKKTFNCVEQYFHYTKMLGEYALASEILNTQSPIGQKRIGNSKVKTFNAEDWDKIRFDVMFRGNMLKFSQNEDLRDALIKTEQRKLGEASPYDLYWGIGFLPTDPRALTVENWRGDNNQGLVLTNIRYWLQQNLTDVHLPSVRSDATVAPPLSQWKV